MVRFVSRSPVAPNNPMPSPLPQIEGLIEEHQLRKSIYRQRSGEDETSAIGDLGEAIAAVDVFADIPVHSMAPLTNDMITDPRRVFGAGLVLCRIALFIRRDPATHDMPEVEQGPTRHGYNDVRDLRAVLGWSESNGHSRKTALPRLPLSRQTAEAR